jgi:hypothetical protein
VSAVAVHADTSTSSVAHVVHAVQTRSLDALAGTDSNWSAVHTVSGAHTRSRVLLPAVDAYSPVAHVLHAAHDVAFAELE